jgi:hypothetical protein
MTVNLYLRRDGVIESDTGEYVFVINCSCSMSGNEIEVAKQSLLLTIHSHFNIYRFESRFETFQPNSIKFNEKSCAQALSYTNGIRADLGGPVPDDPLQDLFSQALSFPNQSRKVIILTDGCVFDKEEVVNLAINILKKIRFTVLELVMEQILNSVKVLGL